jgi:hypothetical protein
VTIDHTYWRKQGVDLEARLWDITTKVAQGVASNTAGVVPEQDSEMVVVFAQWVFGRYLESRQPKQPSTTDVDQLLKSFK